MIENIKKINQNIFIYYSINTFNNFWFITSSWVNYWLKYMSVSEIGIIDALAFGIGVLVEIPSGLISDRLGRKLSLIIASFFQFLGSFIITISLDKFEIAAGFIIFQIGTSLFSGTIEAFGYEECIHNNLKYENLLLKSQYLASFGHLFSLIIGGYFYLVNKNIPNFLWSLNYLISLILSILIVTSSQPSLFENLENSSKLRIRDFIHNFNFKTVFYLVVISSIVFSFDYGFLKLLIMDSFSTIENNYYILSITVLISLILNRYLIKKTKNYENIVKIIYITMALLFIFNENIYQSYVLIFLFLTFLTIYLFQISLNYINTRVRDSVRASFISIFNFAYKIPYIVLSIILGFGIDSLSIAKTLYFIGIFMIFLLVFYKFLYKIVYNKPLDTGA
jgi:MFS family permease